MINTQNTETTYLKIRNVRVGLHPDERVIGILLVGGSEVESTAWRYGISSDGIDIGWPVATREDGAVLVELPHETSYGAWRVWVKADQLVTRQRHDFHGKENKIMTSTPDHQIDADQDVDNGMNDAALCLAIAHEIEHKADHTGKADSLISYALRMLADALVEKEMIDTPVRSVRVLVAIDAAGEWVSSGSSRATDPMEWMLVDDLGKDVAYRWIEADVPLPSPAPSVAGKVI